MSASFVRRGCYIISVTLSVSQMCKCVQMNCLRTASGLLLIDIVTFHDMTRGFALPYNFIIWKFSSSITTKTIYLQWKFTWQFSNTLRTKWNTNFNTEAWSLSIISRCNPVQAIWRGFLSLVIITVLGHCWPTVIKSVEESQWVELYNTFEEKLGQLRRSQEHCVFHRKKKSCCVQYFRPSRKWWWLL
jgi:hypothetical protein